MLSVIVLQEKNAPPPPTLPSSCNTINQCALSLHSVAMQLAELDFGMYPDIRQQIEEAAESIRESTTILSHAINDLLSNADRRAGWDSLLKALKNMAAKTVRLLQIVYGAEREKIFRTAQAALDAIDKINGSGGAKTNPRDFAKEVSDAATKANKLADHVSEKSQDCVSPLQRQGLEDAANQLKRQSKMLIDDANLLLREPNNGRLQQQVDGDLNQLHRTIDDTQQLLRGLDHNFGGDRIEDKTNEIMRGLKELENAGKDSFDEDILYTAKKERQEMENLLDDIDSDDPRAARDALQNAKNYNNKLAKLAGMESNQVEDPLKKKRLLDAQAELERVFPAYEKAANRAIELPDDDRAQDELDRAHNRLNKAIQDLCDIVSNPNAEIGASARKEIDDLQDLREAAKLGDAGGVSRAAKAVVQENKILSDFCTAQGDRCQDPERKKQIFDSVEELQRLLPHQILAAKHALQDPSDKNLDNLDRTTNGMIQQVKSTAEISKSYPELDLLEAAAREKIFLDQLQNDAQRGNPRGVDQTVQPFIDNTHLIGDLAKKIAAKKDRATQAAILDSVTKLERLAEPTARDAKQLAQNPNNPALQQKLAKEVQDMKDLVDKIIADTDAELFAETLKQKNTLASLLNALDEGDRSGIANATKEVAKRQAKITPLARASAKKTEDPMRKKNILDDISELDRLLPSVVGNANKVLANPRDSEANHRLRDSVNVMSSIVGGLGNPDEYDPNIVRRGTHSSNDFANLGPEIMSAAELAARNPLDRMSQKKLQDLLDSLPFDAFDSDREKLANLIKKQGDALTRLTNEAEAGNLPGVNAAMNDVNSNHRAIAEQARKMANDTNNPAIIDTVNGALNSLDRLLPQAHEAAKQVAANPRNEVAKKRMYDVVDDIRDQYDIIEGALIGTNEMRLKDAADKEREALERLRRAVQAGDVPGTQQALNDVKKYNDILTEEGRIASKAIRDPVINKRLLDNITEIEKLMPILAADCNRGAQNPRNAEAQRKAMEDIDRCQALIDAILSDTHADPIALAQIEDYILTEMEGHVKDRSPAAAADVKKLIETQNALIPAALREAEKLNPRAKKNIEDAVAELQDILPQHINNCKAVLQNPNDENLKDNVSDSTAAMRAPLAQIIATLKPTPENIADANRKREAALLARLREAAKAGDRQEVEELLPNIKTINDRLVNQARTEAEKPIPLHKKELLNNAANELETLHNQLPDIARAAAANPNNQQLQAKLAAHTQKMENAMDRIVKALSPEEAASDKAKRIASAMMRDSKNGRIDSQKFLNAAKTLAGYIDNLGDGSGNDSGFDLDSELAMLDKRSSTVAPLKRKQAEEGVDDLLSFLQNMAKNSNNPKSFDELIQAVANDINRNASNAEDNSDPSLALTRAIAAELSKLAQAAKSGQRQQMIEAGRNAATKVNELTKKLQEYALRCKDPHTKDRLLRAIQAMGTYSTQLRILAAVKAADTSNSDADTEDQLVSVTRSLGGCLNEAVSTVKTMQSAKLLR